VEVQENRIGRLDGAPNGDAKSEREEMIVLSPFEAQNGRCMTSSMPWKRKNRRLLTVKDLKTGTVGKTGAIGAICYQIATKT